MAVPAVAQIFHEYLLVCDVPIPNVGKFKIRKRCESDLLSYIDRTFSRRPSFSCRYATISKKLRD
jgi:hypothetical protein